MLEQLIKVVKPKIKLRYTYYCKRCTYYMFFYRGTYLCEEKKFILFIKMLSEYEHFLNTHVFSLISPLQSNKNQT